MEIDDITGLVSITINKPNAMQGNRDDTGGRSTNKGRRIRLAADFLFSTLPSAIFTASLCRMLLKRRAAMQYHRYIPWFAGNLAADV